MSARATRRQVWASRLLQLEPVILTGTILAFAYPSGVRRHWLWLLLLWPLFLAARWLARRRLITRLPLFWPCAALILLAALNVYAAPYTRGLEMLARPLLGLWLCWALIEAARDASSANRPLWAGVALGAVASVLALGATQWSASKSGQMWAVIAALPTIRGLPAFEAGLNPNEIAGALAWLVPLLAGIALGPVRSPGLRPAAGALSAALLLALFLGQSRAALFGVLGALALVALLIPTGRQRWLALLGVAALIALQVAVMTSAFQPARRDAAAARNEISVGSRFDMQANALEIIRAYPLTGVGLNMYRDSRVRQAYPTPAMNNRPPHTHNELLQIGTDMGIPGIAVYIWLNGAAAYMLYWSWRRGAPAERAVSTATAAGLLAHTVYGVADAIPLWDRLAFAHWLMLGLAGAQYALVKLQSQGKSATSALWVQRDLPELG
ncbi:MAG: O-antigen ligase family protein [Aggregatilineales bacterium]